MNICLILSAGSSTRFHAELPKQYNLLAGREVIAYSIEAMRKVKKVDRIVVSCSEDHAERLKERYHVDVVIGGSTRNQSLRNGLDHIAHNYPQCGKVFINEAARPFCTAELIDDYLSILDEYDAAITTQRITDSLGKYGEHIADRSQYYLVQAPEAFRFDLLYEHFSADSLLTATAQQLPPEARVYRHFDFRHNLKITYPEDLLIAEALMRYLN